MGLAIAARTRPECFSQYFWWIPQFIPARRSVQITGLAAICVGRFGSFATGHALKEKLIRSPIELIFYACALIKYWAGLHSGDDMDALMAGAIALQEVAVNVHDATTRSSVGIL